MRGLVVTLFLVLAAPAAAAPHWGDPVPFTDAEPSAAALGVTGDGTRIVAWSTYGNVVLARVGDGPTVTLGSGVAPQVATGKSSAVIAWSDGADTYASLVDGSAPGPSVTLAHGGLGGVRMNRAGDAAALAEDVSPFPDEPTTHLAFRPAGGPFGAAVPAGSLAYPNGLEAGFALGPTGETLFGDRPVSPAEPFPNPIDLYSRDRDGAVTPPYRVPDTAGAYGEVFVDGAGRVLLVHDAAGLTLAASIRSTDGTWSTAPAVFPADLGLPDAGLSGTDDVVLTGRHSGYDAHGTAPGAPPTAPTVVTGSLASGTFSAPVQLPGGRGQGFATATAPDGSTVIAYEDKDANTLWIVRRRGTGAFSAPIPARCGAIGPSAAGIADDGTVTLLIGTATVTETTGTGMPSCTRRPLRGRIDYRPRQPVAGRPVTITVHRFHGTGTSARTAVFRRGRDRVPVQVDDTQVQVRYTFPKAGRAIGWTLTATARDRADGARFPLRRHATVTVVP